MTELSREATALIDAVGTADGPGEDNRARIRRRLATSVAVAAASVTVAKTAGAGVKLATASAAGSAGVGVAKLSTTLTSIALWAMAGGAVGVSVSVPAVMLSQRADTTKVSSVSAPRPVGVVNDQAPQRAPQNVVQNTEAVPPTESLTESVPDVSIAGKARGERSAKPANLAESATPAVTEPATPEASLAQEMQLLKAAQRELSRNRAAAALEMLDAHAAQFPQGVLSTERSAARVLALCAMGRSTEARRLAEEFLRAAPRSPLVPRIRESCAFASVGHE